MVQAAQAAGQVIGGIGQFEAGKFNRKEARIAANNTLQDENDQEARVRENARAAIGEQLAQQGGSGTQMGTGSNLDAIMQSQVNATLDALTLRRQAAARARSQRVQGDIAYARGQNALVGGFLGGVGSGLKNIDWGSSTPAQSAGSSSGWGYGDPSPDDMADYNG